MRSFLNSSKDSGHCCACLLIPLILLDMEESRDSDRAAVYWWSRGYVTGLGCYQTTPTLRGVGNPWCMLGWGSSVCLSD